MTERELRVATEIGLYIMGLQRTGGRDPEFKGIAAILARHYSAPSQPTRSGGLTEPGWYECRHRNDPAQRLARWWDGRFLSENPPRHSCNLSIEVGDYTDFLGPLVRAAPSAGPEPQWALVNGVLDMLTNYRQFMDAWSATPGHERQAIVNELHAILSPPLSTPEERSVENG